MTPTTIVVIALVWAVVGLAVAVWRLRKHLDDHCDILDDLDGVDTMAAEHDRRLGAHHLRIYAVEDSRSRTADIEVPEVDDPPDAPTTPTYRQESHDD